MSAFIDIGANLLDPCFQGRYHGGSQKHEPDLESVIERASAAGVEKVMSHGVSASMGVNSNVSCKLSSGQLHHETSIIHDENEFYHPRSAA